MDKRTNIQNSDTDKNLDLPLNLMLCKASLSAALLRLMVFGVSSWYEEVFYEPDTYNYNEVQSGLSVGGKALLPLWC
jgi:hypothetical protein